MTTTHDEQLQIGMDPSVRELLERAAAASHQSVVAFVVQAAARRAEEVLVERDVIRLSPAAAAAFSEALEAPGQVSERLADVLRRPSGFAWAD